MPDLKIVGGVYIETCIQPLWNAVFGSAGRALQAVAPLISGRATLVTYAAESVRGAAEWLASDCGAGLEVHEASEAIQFDYLHALSTPAIKPPIARIAAGEPIRVTGEVVLRYGMLEGDAIIDADIAIHDPQSAFGAKAFNANGSRAGRLAVVLNRTEAAAIAGVSDPLSAGRLILQEGGAEVVVLKMGPAGALVMSKGSETRVPLYRTPRVWKLGSGDVFSATFAALWGCGGMPAAEAADCASRATAFYCDTRCLPIPSVDELRRLDYPVVKPGAGKVYLAGPFFDLGQRWLIEEARANLLGMGAQVFSPVHEVGPGPAAIVAPEDLAGLNSSDVVLAVLNGLDPGTIFETGYAVKRGIPVIALAQNIKEEDLKMVSGSGCEVVDDFVSAIYRTIWSLPAL